MEAGKMIEIDRNTTKLLLRTARVQWAMGDLSGARKNFDRAFEMVPPGNRLLAEYSLLLSRTMGAGEVAGQWKSSWDGIRKDFLYWNDLGVHRLDAGEIPEAIQAFQCAARLAPENDRILANLAMASACRESGSEAREQLEWIVREFPGQVRAHYLLGMLSEDSPRVASGTLLSKGQEIILSRQAQFLCDDLPQEWEARVVDITGEQISLELINGTRGCTPLRPGSRVLVGFSGTFEFWGSSTEVHGISGENGTFVTVRNPGEFLRVQRRNHVRIGSESIVRRVALPDADGGEDGFENMDISAGGIGFESRWEIARGTRIGIDLALGGTTTHVTGSVVRILRHESDQFRIGVRFSGLSAATREAIAGQIHRIQLNARRVSRPAPERKTGIEIDGYRILERIGSGAMGSVFRAVQLSVNRVVALKVLPPAKSRNERTRQRFRGESRILAQLNHPNIVGSFDAGETNGIQHFSMEYCTGTSVGRKLENTGVFEVPAALAIVTEVARALRYASAKGVVHRDIKPDNILVDDEGNVKLCDFGISRNDREKRTWKTNPGARMGTPHYISPEQAMGSNFVDGRSDLYSLGITLYHMVVGVVPFTGKSAVQVVARHMSEPLPSPRSRNGRIPVGVDYVIRKMTRKRMEDRYADASELLHDLEEVGRGNLPAGLKREMNNRRKERILAG